MAYHEQSFSARLGTMGDASEDAFDNIYPKHHKLGLNRVWADGSNLYLNKMTPAMRYTPDRLIADRFVECMGCGSDSTLKVKNEKIRAMNLWEQNIGPTSLFVYSSKTNSYWIAPVSHWVARFNEHGIQKAFSDGKQFIALNTRNFPCEPTPCADA